MKDTTKFSVEEFNKRYHKQEDILENEIKIEMCKHCLSDMIKHYPNSDTEEVVYNECVNYAKNHYDDVTEVSIFAKDNIYHMINIDIHCNGTVKMPNINYELEPGDKMVFKTNGLEGPKYDIQVIKNGEK